MRRRRLRTWAKWACTLVAGVCVGVAVASAFCDSYAEVVSDGRDVVWFANVDRGLFR